MQLNSTKGHIPQNMWRCDKNGKLLYPDMLFCLLMTRNDILTQDGAEAFEKTRWKVEADDND